MGKKLSFEGEVLAVQPRIRLTRSFDESSHSYLGYVLRVAGFMDDQKGEFLIGVGKGAQTKHQFRPGDEIDLLCEPVKSPRKEPVDYYKVSRIRICERGPADAGAGPPWLTGSLPLMKYRERGHRRLDAATYAAECTRCHFGCRMAVEMIIDHWNPSVRRYRFETFCYGPKSCPLYRAGRKRVVPGRKGMSWTEGDWVDEDATARRGPDD